MSEHDDMQLYRERISALEAEVDRSREVERHLIDITTDLNNILAAMKGQAQLACQDPSGDERDELIRVVLSGTLKAETVLSKIRPRTPVSLLKPMDDLQIDPSPANEGAPAVLVVDDEESMRRLLGRILEDCGCHITFACNGTEAIAVGTRRPFDLAFVDIHLGDINGVEVFKAIRREQPSTHIIFASGDPTLEQIAASTGRQATTYIKKPFDIDEVKKRVSYILTMRAALLERSAG